MVQPLRVLLIEDLASDAELIQMTLERANFCPEITRVFSAEGVVQALPQGPWDIVIADYKMPSFTGLEALRIIRQTDHDLPFILVSGTIDEDVAVMAMKAGAQDYLLKQNLLRLGPAVNRELADAHVRRAQLRSQATLAFLADASKRLPNSLNVQDILQTVCHLVVPAQADVCAVFPDAIGHLPEPIFSCIESIDHATLHTLVKDYAPQPDWPNHPVSEAMRSGRVGVLPIIPDAMRTELARDTKQLELSRRINVRSVLIIPLIARERTLGTVVWASRQPYRYSELDIPLAEEFGTRAALAIDNARLFEEAQAAIRAREDFLLIASHELRTPLTALVLQMAMLRRHVLTHPITFPELHLSMLRMLEKSTHSVERLTMLVENLLDVSRMASGPLPLACSAYDAVEFVYGMQKRVAESAGVLGANIQVDAQGEIPVVWDRLRMEQLLSNLLDNAIKYGADKPITLSLRAPDADHVQIIVHDQGIGIAPVDLARIFGRFERAVSLRNYGGLGLGLYIAQTIVEAHGGSIHAESAQGTGSTFTLTLPRIAPPCARPQAASAPQPTLVMATIS